MEAISDVSRASQIKSCLPRRPPLPDPLDVDELLGFNKPAERKDKVKTTEYFETRKIFINHIDSFIGRHVVSTLISKGAEEITQISEIGNTIRESEKAEENSRKSKTTKKEKVSKESKPKGKGKSSFKNDEGKKTKKSERKSASPEKINVILAEDSEEDLKQTSCEEKICFDTSKLTVAEYYEMLELPAGPARTDYLKQKLMNYCSQPKRLSLELENTNMSKTKHINETKMNNFQIVGTLKDSETPEIFTQEDIEILQLPQENISFIEQLMKCWIIIYIVTEDLEQVIEASWVLGSLIDHMESAKEKKENFSPPMFILLSSFMTWVQTPSLDPKEPELPLIEKDYKRRISHHNFKPLYDLENKIVSARLKGDIEAAILVCGISYGHEEDVFSMFFKMAFDNMNLPVYGHGNNYFPVVHVENIGRIIKQVIDKWSDIKLPFIFAKDPLDFTLKEIVKAISINFGSGCFSLMPSPFAFLNNVVTQNLFDQLTSNINMVSCYPLFKEEDINWKYETGFVQNITSVVKEYMDAMNIKPVRIALYTSGFNDEVKNVVVKLSENLQLPTLDFDNVILDYVTEMVKEDQLKRQEEVSNNRTTISSSALNNKVQENAELEEVLVCQNDDNLERNLELLKKLDISTSNYKEKLSEDQQISILKEHMKKRLFLNKGYILINYPLLLNEAKTLFYESDIDHSNEEDSYLPDYVVYLSKAKRDSPSKSVVYQSTDQIKTEDSILKEDDSVTVKDRQSVVSSIEGMEVNEEGTQNDEPYISDQQIIEEMPVIKYVLENNEKCKLCNIRVNEFDGPDGIVKTIIESIYDTRSYDDSLEVELSRNEEITAYDNKENLSTRLEDEGIDTNEEIITKEGDLNELKEAEETVLAIRSYPLLRYLINYVYPTLTNALLEVTAMRPEDPLDFMAQYLFENNPGGRMMPSDESKTNINVTYQGDKYPKANDNSCVI